MKAITIDFAPRTMQRAISRSDVKARWLFIIALVLCVTSVISLSLVGNRQQAYQDRLAEMDSANASAQAAISRPALVLSAGQVAAVNTIIQQLNFPWHRLFDTLELVTPTSIALLELMPDAKKHMIKGIAEADTMDAALNYIARLNRQSALGSVVLSKHEVNIEDVNKPVKFEFEAIWVESAQ
jgi:hypothetical protein